MDEYPFELPLELCEKIFNYLNSSDLLSCTLVSHGWNQFLGCNFMKNILLKVDDKINIKDIEKSERIYRRAKVTQLSKENLYSVIKFLSPTIVEMELDEVIYRGDTKFVMKLPHLKELTLSCCSTDILKLFKLKCEKLKSLSLYQLNHGSSENVRNFLNSNGSIEEINFYLSDNFRIFDDDILSDTRLDNLKSIFISYKSNEELQSLTLKNIEAFLIAQGDRLLTLSLLHATNLLLLIRIWNHLKAVKRLYFFSTDPFFDYCDELLTKELKENIYLTELELHSLAPYPFTLEDVKPFLDASPNLRSLAVWHLRKDIAKYAKLKNLKSISYVTADDDCKSYLKSKNGTNDKLRFNQY